MAIGTPTTLGTGNGGGGFVASVTVTTTAAVTAGNLIIVAVGWYGATVTATMSGGSLTWTQHKNQQGAADTNYHCAIFSAQAPAGLVITTVLTCSFSASCVNTMICAAQCSGLATSSVVDTTGGANTSATSTAWGTGNVTTSNANDLLFGACTIDALITDTATSPATELHDFQNAAANVSMTTVYRIVSATGTYSMAGTLSSSVSLERVAPIVAFSDGGGGGGATVKQLAQLGVG